MNDPQDIRDGRFIITAINGQQTFKSFLLGHNIAVGSAITINYSPKYAQLISITVRQKILSIRTEDFKNIECVRIA